MEWFYDVDIMNVIIDIKDIEKICGQISASDYSNNNSGFELQIINDSILSKLYDPEL